MGILIQDVRYALRVMRASPVFTTVALLSLALGIGANTSIFSLIDKFLLKPLPVRHPEQLITLYRVNPGGTGESFTYPQFERFRDRNHSVAGLFGFAYRQTGVSIDGRTEQGLVQLASPEYFSTLGIHAISGRVFTASNEGTPLAVISYDFWKRRFGLDASATGKTVVINGRAFQIAGIAPAGFYGVALDYAVDVWVPLGLQPQVDGNSMLAERGPNCVRIIPRFTPGPLPAQARADLYVVFAKALQPGAPEPQVPVV